MRKILNKIRNIFIATVTFIVSIWSNVRAVQLNENDVIE